MSVKVVVVVLVVIVLLFVAAVVIGGSQGEANPDDRNALIDRLGNVANDPSAVPRDDVSAVCVDEEDPDRLVINGECTVIVRSDKPLRLLGLLAVSAVVVEAPAPEGDLVVTKVVAAGDDVRVAVADGQTAVHLSCPPLISQCEARLVAA